MSNTSPADSLEHDRFPSAMLQLRNTPDPDCSILPAQIIFGRPLRDTLSFVNRLEKFPNPHVSRIWRQAWTAKEDALGWPGPLCPCVPLPAKEGPTPVDVGAWALESPLPKALQRS